MEIKVPEVGESIYEATIGQWHKKNGDFVHKDELICELETDKINLEILAEADGMLQISAQEEETVKIGASIGQITPGQAPAGSKTPSSSVPQKKASSDSPVNPAAKRLAAESGVDLQLVQGSGRDGRITRDDVVAAQAAPAPAIQPAPTSAPSKAPAPSVADDPRSRRVRMTPIRRKIAERLLQARQQTAMLTTFNEADMSRVISLRKKFNEHFEAKHGIKLGFMSFFVKAVIEGLKEVPEVNGRIDGEDIVYQDYFNIGIAVGAKKGLVVPVLKDADDLTFAGIEKTIRDFAERANSGKLQLSDLEGGTFTISNGGVYGSMMSTPILNPPQSGILGMHAINKRPVVIDDEVQVRPMMYLALSYDHRIIDGQQAVTFLNTIKENIEAPEEMLLEM